jgi:hypothetical protein
MPLADDFTLHAARSHDEAPPTRCHTLGANEATDCSYIYVVSYIYVASATASSFTTIDALDWTTQLRLRHPIYMLNDQVGPPLCDIAQRRRTGAASELQERVGEAPRTSRSGVESR